MADAAHLEALRARIRALERPGTEASPVLAVGVPAVDDVLPWGGLPLGRLHQVTGGEDGFAGPALAFVARLAARAVGPVLWVVAQGSADDALYGPGLAVMGLTPDRLLVARARDDAEVLWCMEEGLRCPALGVVVGQPRGIDLTAGRRLQLAAEQGGAIGFLLGSGHGAGWRLAKAAPAAAATTRWRVDPAPAAAVPWNGLGRARWTVTLERCQGGLPRSWLLEVDDETGDLAVVPTVPDRQDAHFRGPTGPRQARLRAAPPGA